MKRVALTVLTGLLVLASTAWSSQVTNVELSYHDGLTVARIDIDGPVRYTHETEVPKDGRPDRVIVDVLSATHELGAKTFTELPACIITGVRTSQFAVTPEKIVRIVFDLSTASLYRVSSDDHSVTITFDRKEPKSFATWSTSRVVAAAKAAKAKKVELAQAPVKKAEPKEAAAPPKTAVEKNKVIESDRMLSLADSKPAVTTAPAAPAPKKAAPAPAQKVDRSLSGRNFSEADFAPAEPAPAKPAPAKVETKEAPAPPTVSANKNVTTKTTAVEPKSVRQKTAAPAKPAAVKPTPAANNPAPAPVKAKEPEVKAKEAAKTNPPAPAALPKQKVKTDLAQKPAPKKTDPAPTGQQALAKKVTGEKADKPAPVVAKSDPKPKADEVPAQRPTARFRRKGESAKIRGTMVAEFPKRLVIKYQAGGRRDPFSSLLDSERTYDDPVGNRIPNIEGLRLVGIIESDGATNRALFEDKSGFSYILKTGDKVRNGYVLRVESDQVYFQIFEYGWSRTVALTME